MGKKPRCPFCGGKLSITDSGPGHGVAADCRHCRMDIGHYKTKKKLYRALRGKKKQKVKPCPLCGSKVNVVEFRHFNGGSDYMVRCHFCYLDVGVFNSKRDAVRHWNARPTDGRKDA